MKENIEPLIDGILRDNVVDIIQRESLEQKLRSGKKLRIKLGFDPTSPDLHLGHAIVLRKLRQFQDAGHKVVFIIGDFTTTIGDPSGASQLRPMLSREAIKKNSKTYFQQVGKILDAGKAEIRRNSEWLSKVSLERWLGILRQFTVSRILERDDFQKRLKGGQEVWLHEIMYPLLQAYDSYAIKADIEIGATDQLFNLLAGRALQEKLGQPPQDILTTEILVGLDGLKKMSKSIGNYIGLAEPAGSMFGKLMSLKDELMPAYFRLATTRAKDEVADIERRMSGGENPRDIKLDLATEVVSLYHGPAAGMRARAEFIKVFSKKEMPSAMNEVKLSGGSYEAVALLMSLQLAKSKSEARRLIEQGGIEIIPKRGVREKLENPLQFVAVTDGTVIRAGKTRFVRIRVL